MIAVEPARVATDRVAVDEDLVVLGHRPGRRPVELDPRAVAGLRIRGIDCVSEKLCVPEGGVDPLHVRGRSLKQQGPADRVAIEVVPVLFDRFGLRQTPRPDESERRAEEEPIAHDDAIIRTDRMGPGQDPGVAMFSIFGIRRISSRRFFSFPSLVELSPIGSNSPNPAAER